MKSQKTQTISDCDSTLSEWVHELDDYPKYRFTNKMKKIVAFVRKNWFLLVMLSVIGSMIALFELLS